MTAVVHNNSVSGLVKENNPPVFEILGVRVSAVNLDLAVGHIDDWIKARSKVYVCVAPVSTVMDCQDDPEYKNVVNAAAMVTPDGMPIVWLGRWQGNKEV